MAKLPPKAVQRQIAAKVAAEQQAQRQADAATAFSAALLCHAKQADFVRAVLSPPKRHRLRWSAVRQVTRCRRLWDQICLGRDNVSVLYVAATRDSVKRMAWKASLAFNREHQLGGVPNYTDLTLTFPNGSAS